MASAEAKEVGFSIKFSKIKHKDLFKKLLKAEEEKFIEDIVFNIIIQTEDDYYRKNFDTIAHNIIENLEMGEPYSFKKTDHRIEVGMYFSNKVMKKIIGEKKRRYRVGVAKASCRNAKLASIQRLKKLKFNKWALFSIGRYFKYKALSLYYVAV